MFQRLVLLSLNFATDLQQSPWVSFKTVLFRLLACDPLFTNNIFVGPTMSYCTETTTNKIKT